MAIVRMKSHDYGPQGALGKPVPSASASTSTVEQVRVCDMNLRKKREC